MLQIHTQRKKEMRKLGRMVPYYTLMECTMVASPILAAIASFLTFAAIADPSQFTPGAIFSAVALFGILRPPVEELPHAMVEVGNSPIAHHQRTSAVGKLCTGMMRQSTLSLIELRCMQGHPLFWVTLSECTCCWQPCSAGPFMNIYKGPSF